MSVGDVRRNAFALALLLAIIAPLTTAAPLSDSTEIESYDEEAGCYYNFQHYGEGDRIMTNEPCLNCTCHNRMLMCYLRVCPFTKPIGQDCTVEKRGDQCCPIITCPDVPVDLVDSTTVGTVASTEVGHHDSYGCSIDGRFYTDGAQVPSKPNKPCELCYCIRNMTACVMQECTLHVEGCTPVYQRGVCCPVRYSCDHPEEDGPLMIDDMTTTTVRPTPGFILTTTLTPGYTMECTHHDEVFADGAMIATDKACEHCYCMKGDIVCAVQECGTPMENEGKNCTAIAPKEGQCCPDNFVCEGEEAPTTVLSESDKDSTTEDIKMIEQEIETSKPAVDASHADVDSDKHATTESIEQEIETSKPVFNATTALSESDKEATTESLKHAPELETDSDATIADSDIEKVATTEGFIHEQELSATKVDQDVSTNLHADKDATTQVIQHEPEIETSKPEYDATTKISESDKEATTEGLRHVPETEKESDTTVADFETDKAATTEGFKHLLELDATTEHSDKDNVTPEIGETKPEIDVTTILSESNKDATTEGFKHEQEKDTSKLEQDGITVHSYVDQEVTTQGLKHEQELETIKPGFDASNTLSETDKDATAEPEQEIDTPKPEVATTVHPYADEGATTEGIKHKPELETSRPELDATTILSDTDKDATTEDFKHEHELKATKPEPGVTTLHPYADQNAIKQDNEPELETSKPELDATTVLSETDKDVTTEGFKHEHEIKITNPEQDVTTLHPYADQDATTQGIKRKPELETSEPEFDATTVLSKSDKDVTTENIKLVPETETSKPISDVTSVDSETDKPATTEGFNGIPEIETSKPDSDATSVDTETDKATTTEGFKHQPEVESSKSESDATTEHSDVSKYDATERIKDELEIEVTKLDMDATTILPESVKYTTTQGIQHVPQTEEGTPFGGLTTLIPDGANDSTTQGIKIEQDLEVFKPDEATIQSTEEETTVTERILTQTTSSSIENEDISKTTVGLRDNKGENEELEENVSKTEISEHTDKVTESSTEEIDSTETLQDHTSPKDILLVPSTEGYGSDHISYDQKTDNAIPEKVDEFTGKPSSSDSATDGHVIIPSVIEDTTDAESHTTPIQTEDKIDEEEIEISQQEIVGQEVEKTPSVKKEDHTVSGLSEIETTTSSLISGQSITKESDIETTKYPDYFDHPYKSSSEPTDDFEDVFDHTDASEIGGSTSSDNLNTRYTNKEDADKTSASLPVSENVKDKTDDFEKHVTPVFGEHVTKIPLEESSGDGIVIDEFGSGEFTTVESLDSAVHIGDESVEPEIKKPTPEIEKVTHIPIPSTSDEHSAENDSSEQDVSQEITTDHLIDDEITTIHEVNEADITVKSVIDSEIHEVTTASIIADLEHKTNIPVEISSESGQEFTTTHSVSKFKTDKPTSEKEPDEEVFESTTSSHDTDDKESEKEFESTEKEHIPTPLTGDGHADADDVTGKYDLFDKTTESHKLDQETGLPEISELDLGKNTNKPEDEEPNTAKPDDHDIIPEISQTASEKDHLTPEEGYEHTTLDSTKSSDNEYQKTEDHDIQQKTTLLPERESDIKDLHVTTPSVKDVTDPQNIQSENTQMPLHSIDEETGATKKLSDELDHTEKNDIEDNVHPEHDITTLSSNEYDSYSEIPHVTNPEDIDGVKDDDKEVTLLPHDDHTYSLDEKTSLPVEVTTMASVEKIEVTTVQLSSVTEEGSHSQEHSISEDEIKLATTTVSSKESDTDDVRTKVPEQITTETPTTVIDLQENEINEDHHKQPTDDPRIPGEGDCLVDGNSYKNKALIPTANRCQTSCQCVNSIIKCEHVVCSPPPSNMVNCQPVYHGKDTCCPMYTCEHESVTIESDNQMSEHSTPSVDQSIKHITESPIEDDKIHEDDVTEQIAVSYKPTKDFTSGIEKGTTQLPVEEKPIIPSIYIPDCGTAGCKITKTPNETFPENYDTTEVHVTSGEYTTLHSITDTKQHEVDSQTLRPVSSDLATERPNVQDQTTLISEHEKEIKYQQTEKSTEEYDIQKTTVMIPSHVSDDQDESTEDAVKESTGDNVKVEIATATPEYISVTKVATEKESSTETLQIADHEKDHSEQTQTDIELTTTTSEKETIIPDIHQLGHDEDNKGNIDTDLEDKEQTTKLDTYDKTEQSLNAVTTKVPGASVDDSHISDVNEISSTPNIVKSETISPSIDENKIVEDDHTEKTVIDEENGSTFTPDHEQKIFNQVETTSKPTDVIDEDDKKSQESTTKLSTEQITSAPVIDYTTVSSDDVNKIGVSVLPTDSVDEISPKKPDSSVEGDCGHAGCQVEAQYTNLPIDITTVAPVSGDCQSGDCKTKSSEKPKESDCGENGCEDDEQNTIGDDLDKPVCGPNGCDYGTKHDKIDSTTEIYVGEIQTSVPPSSKPSEDSSTKVKVDCDNGLCTSKEEIPDHHEVSEEHKETIVTQDQCSGKGCADKPIDVPVKTDDGEDVLHGDKHSQTIKPDQSTSYPDGCSSPSCLEKTSGSTESPTTTKIPISDEKCFGENCEEAKLPSGEDKCTGVNCGETELPIGEEKCSGDNCEETTLPVGEDKCTGDSCEKAELPIGEEKCTGESCSTKSELESGTKPSLEDSQIDEQQKLDGHEITSKPDLSSEKEPQGTEVTTRETTESADLGDDKITLRPTVEEKSTDKTVDKPTTEISTEIPQTTGYVTQQQEKLSTQFDTVKTDSTTVKAVDFNANKSTTLTTEISEEHTSQDNEIESTKKPVVTDVSSEDDQHLEETDHTKSQTSKTTIGSDTETYTVSSVTQSVDEDDFTVTDSEHVTDSHKHVDHEVDEKDNQIKKGDDSTQLPEYPTEPALTGRPDTHVTTAFEDPESIGATTSIDKTEIGEKEPTEHSLDKEKTTVRPATDTIKVKDDEPLTDGEDDKVTKTNDFVTEAGIEHSTVFDENKEDKLDIDQVNYDKLTPTTVRTQEDEKTTDKPLADKTEKPINVNEISHTTVAIESNEDNDVSDEISTDESEKDDSVRTTVTESEIIKSTTHAQESITPASETSHEEDVTVGVDQTKDGGIVKTEPKDTHITTESDVIESTETPKPTIYIEDVVHTTAVYTDDDNNAPIEQEIENEPMHTTLSSHDDDIKKPTIPIEDMKHAETTPVDDSKKVTEPTIGTDNIDQTTLSPTSEDKHITKLDSGIEITPTTVLPTEDNDKTTVPSKYEEDQEATEPSKEGETAHTTSHAEHDAERVTGSVNQSEIEDQTEKTEKDEVVKPTESDEKDKTSQITKLNESGTEKYTTVPMAEDEETVTQKSDIEKQSEENTDVTPSTVSAEIPESTEVPEKETEKGEQKPEQHLTTRIPVDEQVTEHEKIPHETDFTKGQDIDQTIDFGEEEIDHTTTISVDQIKVQGPSDEGIYPTVSGEGEQPEIYTTHISENVEVTKPTEEEIIHPTISGEHVTTAKIPVDQPEEAYTITIPERDESEKPTEKPEVAHTTISVDNDSVEKSTEQLEEEADQTTEKNKVKTPAEQPEEGNVHTATVSSGGDEANVPTDKPEYENHTTLSLESDENKKPTEQTDNDVVQTTVSSEIDETKRPTEHSVENKHTTVSSESNETKKPEKQTDEDLVQTTISSESDESKRPTEHPEDEKLTSVSSEDDEAKRTTEKPEDYEYHTTISADQYEVKKPTEHPGDETHTIVPSEGDTTKSSTEKSEADIPTTVSSDKYDQEKSTLYPKDSEQTTATSETDEAKSPTDKPEGGVDHTTISSESDDVKKPTAQTDKDVVQTTVSSERDETKKPTEHSEDDKYTTVSSDDEKKSTEKPGADAAHTTISADKYDVKKPIEHVEEEAHTTVRPEFDESNRHTEHPEDSVHTTISVESDEGKRTTDKPEHDVDHTTITSEGDEVKKPTEQTDEDVIRTTVRTELEETKPTKHYEDDKYTTVSSDDENKSTEKPGTDDAHTTTTADKYDVKKPTEHVEEEAHTTIKSEIDESDRSTEHPEDSVHTTVGVESDGGKKPTEPTFDQDHTTIISESDEVKKTAEQTDKEVVEATTSSESDEAQKSQEESVEDEKDEHKPQISEKQPDTEATTASDESTPFNKSSEYPFTSTVTVHDYITSKMPIAAEVTTEEPYQSSSKYPDTAIDPGLDQAEISSIPNPDEDEDHQVPQLPNFPPSYGSSGNEEPDYEGEDQAFGPGTCRYGGKVYVSAQQIPRDDPCDFCFCFRSDIICLQQSCPPPIQHCHEEPIQGFCCPRYECPVSMATVMNVTTTTTTTTTTLPPHFLSHAYKGAAQRRGCQIKGQSYQVGETIKQTSGPCLHCICGSDGQMKCDPKVCTPEPMLRQMIAVAATSRRR